MPEFPVNPTRIDPYKTFKFRVKWDGQYIPAISHVSGLVRTTEVVVHREGGDPNSSHKATGLTDYAPIVLQRGLTEDPAFENWANLVWKLGGGPESSLNEFRKNIYIELYNEAGQLVRGYKVYRCWPSSYQALSDLDANGNALVIEQLKLENEGWERDTSITEPKQP